MSGSGSAASAISRAGLSNSVSSIFPTLFPDQGNEADAAEVRLLKRPVRALRRIDEILDPAGASNRHDDASLRLQLLDERGRDMASARSGKDRVERRFFGPAPGAVAVDDSDIAVAEP